MQSIHSSTQSVLYHSTHSLHYQSQHVNLHDYVHIIVIFIL